MIIESTFKPAWWLANAHAQTVYATLTRRTRAPIDAIERVELPDGDFLDLAWAVNGLSASAPLVILLHGLGGGVHSTYVAGLLRAFNQHGWRGVLLQFRSASAVLNRLPRAYHSGDTGDFDTVMRLLCEREPNTKKAAVGISIGGNVLLKWLGEQTHRAPLHSAVAVSVPFQLKSVADRMNQGFSRVYQAYLLRKLRGVFQQKIAQHPDSGLPSAEKLQSMRCFWTFDDQVTAPLHGFAHVHDYYRKASSLPYLQRIATPTLMIHALDDPFMSPVIIPTASELSAHTVLEISRKGGHVGFITGHIPGCPNYWLDERIPNFLHQYL